MKVKTSRQVESDNLRISGSFKPDTLDLEKRTVEVIFSSGARGLRYSFFGNYYEELEISKKAIDLTRLNMGAPVLAAHDSSTLDAVIGVVLSARIDEEAGLAYATIKFASDEYSERQFQKVRDGILKNISVGYNAEYEEISDENDEVPVFLATRWTPMEISFVPIGFDYKAQVRSEKTNKTRTINVTRNNQIGDNEMDPKLKKEESEQTVDHSEAIQKEQTRCLEIRQLVRAANMKDEMADEYIRQNTSVETVKTNLELFKKYQQESKQNEVQPTTQSREISVGTVNHNKRRELIINALIHRLDSKSELIDDAREYVNLSLVRIMERHLQRGPYESDHAFIQRVMTTSDLPQILSNVAEKSAQERYKLAPKTFEAWTSKGTLKDYKPTLQVRGGDVGELKPMTEAGEYTESTIGEEHENAQLQKYGVIHSFSDQMLVNDDLDLILSIARDGATAQARLDNRLAYAALTSNPTMADGYQLFSSEHKNLGTAGIIGETTFKDAFSKMRSQKSVDGRDYLNLAPKFLLVGPDNEVAAKKFLAAINPVKSGEVNVFTNSVIPIVDAEISGDEYYFVADPMVCEGVKINRLRGQENVRVDSRSNWRNDAIELKLSYAVQAKAMDYRALVKNTGDEE